MCSIFSHLETAENYQVTWSHVRVSVGTDMIIDSKEKSAQAKARALLVRHSQPISVKNTAVTRRKNSCSLSRKTVSIKDAGIKIVQGKVLSGLLNSRGIFILVPRATILLTCGRDRELSIPAAGQNDRGLWGREWGIFKECLFCDAFPTGKIYTVDSRQLAILRSLCNVF